LSASNPETGCVSAWSSHSKPGDIIFTGTLSGVGHARKPDPIWMRDGDVCEIEIEGVGMLRNPIVNEHKRYCPAPPYLTVAVAVTHGFPANEVQDGRYVERHFDLRVAPQGFV
jgi:hypothetical protein